MTTTLVCEGASWVVATGSVLLRYHHPLDACRDFPSLLPRIDIPVPMTGLDPAALWARALCLPYLPPPAVPRLPGTYAIPRPNARVALRMALHLGLYLGEIERWLRDRSISAEVHYYQMKHSLDPVWALLDVLYSIPEGWLCDHPIPVPAHGSLTPDNT